ncbi:hypothetical protein FFT09_03820 [Saccharomonospora piscinae]|uniref:hypothetical protein n=1 Tax=Saccharomonospora piscinae TaxID=687388 RepID=UPI001105A3B2|nr:hypothetical protein [Saccharomonospora piscinae]TLW94988.1 hypothetical protein FFT09_03820 [Saccharomonospora piscinae]
MRTARVLLSLAGLAALAWGGVLAFEFVTTSARWPSALWWFAGGTLAHDFLVAPLVGVAGVLLARVLPEPWRAPVAAGAVLSAVLVLLAVPLLYRPYPAPANPGLHDRDYPVALALTLVVVWLVVLAAGLFRHTRRRGG